jgi:hypothetical protein
VQHNLQIVRHELRQEVFDVSVRNSEIAKLSRKVSAEVPDDVEQQDNEWIEGADDADESGDTTIMEAGTTLSDNVGDSSVQLDVAQLLAEVEAEASKGVDANGRVRRRLEAIMERKRRHQDLLDFEDYDLDS